jgi:K+/H+ antiporter YhaU regulatory subunit KhtT
MIKLCKIMKIMKIMKIIKKTSILAMLCIGLLSCNSEIESLEFEEANLTSKKSKSSESTINYAVPTAGNIVDLATAGDFVILSKSGITNVSSSTVRGNVGTSPITGAALLLTDAEVIGNIYTVGAAGPAGNTVYATGLTIAVGDMENAYTNAAGLTNSLPDATFLNRGAGILGGGVILEPGVYTWGSTLLIPDNITLSGTATDEWVFQVAGTLTMSNDVKMILSGSGTGPDAENVFWQVSGAVTLGTGSEFVGNLLGKTSIAVQTGATVEGRLLAQTAVTLQKNIVYTPAQAAQAAQAVQQAIDDAAAAQKIIDDAAAAQKIIDDALAFANRGVGSGLELGTAGKFAILSKSGVTNVFPSVITGNVGTRPITGAALLLTCGEVNNGVIYTVDAAGPLTCRVTDASGLSTAVGDMQAAYNDAAGRNTPDFVDLGAGSIGGLTLAPGLYKWSSALLIPTDITLQGDENDIWIFQVAGTLTMSNGKKMTLSKKDVNTTLPKTENIFWQVAGAVTLGTTSHFEGTLLGKTSIAVQTDATVNGRLLAQTAVTLQKNTVTGPSAATVPLI